jgi:hypothetical protein
MIELYGYLQDGYWTFQKDKHVENGWWIQIQGKEYVVFEIPEYGGNPHEVGRYKTLDKAFDIAVNLA